jgi:hypothetical protein
MKKELAKQIAKALGYRDIADAVDVEQSAVRAAVSRGSFPATWYMGISNLAAKRGVYCPFFAFSFREPRVGLDGFLPSKDYATSCAESQENNDIYGVAV